MNDSMDNGDFRANFNDKELGRLQVDYSGDNPGRNFRDSTSFAGTGVVGEGNRLVLPNPSSYSNGNANQAPISPSTMFGQVHRAYQGFLFPRSQQPSRGSQAASVGPSPVHSGSSSPLLSGSGRGKEKKKRRRLAPEETRMLVQVFEVTQKPNGPLRRELAARLDMTSRAIQIWFQNRRAKVKRDAGAGWESESGIEATPPPEDEMSGMMGSEYSSATCVHGTPLGSPFSTPNRTPSGSPQGTPKNRRAQKISLAHSVADSLLLAKNMPQNFQVGPIVRPTLPGSPQPFGGNHVTLTPRPTTPVPIAPNLNQGHYVHASHTQPQHQHVLLQLHQQNQQQLRLQQLQQQQQQQQQQQNSADRWHRPFLHQPQQNGADNGFGNQHGSFFSSPMTRDGDIDPARLEKDDGMDLDVYPMTTSESAPAIPAPSYHDPYATQRLGPFLFDANAAYLTTAEPGASSPTTAEFLSSYLTAAERSVLAEDSGPAPTGGTGANDDADLFDAFRMFTRGSGDDLNLFLGQASQDAVHSPSGRRRYSVGVNDPFTTHEPASEHFPPRRSRSMAAIFDSVPTMTAPGLPGGPNEYWNAELPVDALLDSLLSNEPPTGTSAFDAVTERFDLSGGTVGADEAFVAVVDNASQSQIQSDSSDTRRGLPDHVRKKLGTPLVPSPMVGSSLPPVETYTTTLPPPLGGGVSSPRSKRRRSVSENVDLLTQLNLGWTQSDQNGSGYHGQPKEKRGGFAM